MRMAFYLMKCKLASYFFTIGNFCMDWLTWFFAFFLKKDLGKLLFPKALEWVKENVRIEERAGLKFYIFDKEFPLYMKFALGRESEYSEMALWNTAFFELFSTELNSVRIWREGCDICAYGKKHGPLDFRKIDGNLLHKYGFFAHVGYFNYKVKTIDQAIDLIAGSLDKTDFADEIPDYFQSLWFVKLWKKFNFWMHEIDCENAWNWAKEHCETIKIECRHGEIEAMLLYDNFPENLNRYCGICCKRADVFYMKDCGDPSIKCGGLSTSLDWLDLRKLPEDVVLSIAPAKKNSAIMPDVISPTNLAKIIKNIE